MAAQRTACSVQSPSRVFATSAAVAKPTFRDFSVIRSRTKTSIFAAAFLVSVIADLRVTAEGGRARRGYSAFVRALFAKRARSLGFEPRTGEPDADRWLRPILLDMPVNGNKRGDSLPVPVVGLKQGENIQGPAQSAVTILERVNRQETKNK